jgi:hypothetical protein
LESNEEVIVNGFNLSLSSNTGAVVNLKTTTAIPLLTQSPNKLTLNLPANAVTGAFKLTVSGIEAVNNRNDNRNTWNSEASASVEGSALWNDDRNVHVWQSNNTNTGTGDNANRGYFHGSEKPVHPAMTKHPTTGVLYASWSEYKNSRAYWGRNNVDTPNAQAGTSATPAPGYILSTYDPPEHTDIHIGRTDGTPTVAYNANTYGNGGWVIGQTGGTYVWDRQANAVYSSGGNAYVAENLVHDQMLAQFENQRVVTSGDNIHVSYYDTDTKSLKYWYNGAGTNVTSTQYTNNTILAIPAGGTSRPNNRWINLDGGFDGNDLSTGTNNPDRVLGRTGGGTAGSNVNVVGNRGAANGDVGSSSQAGEFSAIDLTSEGYPVIAYYDVTNQTVKLAYSNAVVALTTANWKRQNVLSSNDPNYKFSGKYISMRIDRTTGRIHMVFNNNSKGNLIYVTGTRNDDFNGYTFSPSVIIDSVGNVGKWSDLSLDADGNPWVSYIDTSRVDSFDGVKMAFCLDSTKLSDPNAWETVNACLYYNVGDARTSIENWDTAAQFWDAAIGYASDDFYRIAYYIKPNP